MWPTFFGADIERAERGDDNSLNTHGPKNLLTLLPEAFTISDAKRVRQQEGLDAAERKCRNMLYQWVHRGYILQLTADSYKKAYTT